MVLHGISLFYTCYVLLTALLSDKAVTRTEEAKLHKVMKPSAIPWVVFELGMGAGLATIAGLLIVENSLHSYSGQVASAVIWVAVCGIYAA